MITSEALRSARLSVNLCEALAIEDDIFVRVAALKTCVAIEEELIQATMFKVSMLEEIGSGLTN